jgi:malonyl-CoA/methylmalonyl-CoA synthetase
MTSLDKSLQATAVQRGSAPALIFDQQVYSYDDLSRAARGCAAGLLATGLRAGDRVVVGLASSPALIETVLGALYSGAILVPVNPAATADELLYIVNDAGARTAIVEPAHADVLHTTGVAGISVFAGNDAPRVDNTSTLSVDSLPDAAALIIYTSGTTGRPKGAVLSHRALTTNLRTVAQTWRWTATDRLLLTLPCFHLHGLGLGLLTSFLVGSSVVLRPRFAVEDVLGDLAASGCTMFFGVPTMYNRLVALPADAERGLDLSRVRLWVSGSAPLNAVTFERFRDRFGYALMDRYGMTECGFALSTPYDEARRPGVVGRPLPGVSVRLVDAEAADSGAVADVPDGTQGEILIRGPNLFSGYWNRRDETGRAMLDGYLRSGDLAVREADGMLRIIGRSSVDIIKTRGFKVGAVEIEEALQRHPAVQEVAVVGLPDADQGERVVAAVIVRPGMALSLEELRAHARSLLAPHKVPAEIVIVDEIPKTGPGKFKKKELIARLCKAL